MANKDDEIGCAIAVIAASAAGWWLWSNYEVREREPEPIAELAAPVRPMAWVGLTTTQTGTVYTLNAATVKGGRTARSAWVYMDHSKDAAYQHRATRELSLVNCETGGVKTLSHIEYDADDKILGNWDQEEDEAKTTYYPPGSVGAALPNEICDAVYDEPVSDAPADSSQ